jgi:hypothetical protein
LYEQDIDREAKVLIAGGKMGYGGTLREHDVKQ